MLTSSLQPPASSLFPKNSFFGNKQSLIIVLGVRRSGTSALIKGLETMGVSIVDQAATPFNSFNPTGYWEDVEIHHLNMKLVHALNCLQPRWRSIIPLSEKEADFLCEQGFLKQGVELLLSKISAVSKPLGLKDPRFSMLLPFWKRVFKECHLNVSFLISLRDPFSAIASMESFARESEPINNHYEKFLWTWISFLLGCLEGTAGEKRILVDYQDLLTQPDFQIKRIAAAFHLEVQEELLKKYSTNFLDPLLCHFKMTEFSRNHLNHDQKIALEIYEQLLLVARDEISFEQLQPALEKWKGVFAAVEQLLVMAEKNEQTLLLHQAAVLVYREKLAKIGN
ncbi:MAG: hypothetical protein FJ390_03325 [Verrucomicrobia bacterium]|nr:hypothetical protein [Verrucomicrobiota bacterium]